MAQKVKTVKLGDHVYFTGIMHTQPVTDLKGTILRIGRNGSHSGEVYVMWNSYQECWCRAEGLRMVNLPIWGRLSNLRELLIMGRIVRDEALQTMRDALDMEIESDD